MIGRGAISFAVTAAIAALLYHCRTLTFIVWTNAEMMDHAQAHIVVAAIEALIVLIVGVAVWFVVEFGLLLIIRH